MERRTLLKQGGLLLLAGGSLSLSPFFLNLLQGLRAHPIANAFPSANIQILGDLSLRHFSKEDVLKFFEPLASEKLEKAEIIVRLNSMIRDDFNQENLTLLDGWVFARSEAMIFALLRSFPQ